MAISLHHPLCSYNLFVLLAAEILMSVEQELSLIKCLCNVQHNGVLIRP